MTRDGAAAASSERPADPLTGEYALDSTGVCTGRGRNRRTRPLTVTAEFVAVGGREGKALEARQLAVIWEILQWLHQQKSPGKQDD